MVCFYLINKKHSEWKANATQMQRKQKLPKTGPNPGRDPAQKQLKI